MKVETNSTPLEMGGVKVEGEFRIRNSAKAFSILSSGLYSNKIEAILRELGCNAYDSHVEAGKADVPFTVHLPTSLNPQFYVRDYGIGLDHEGVTQLYTTYFESTKQDSNDYVGCLGLGSKSPFSYTRNFTVTATKDGTERMYNCFINEQGIPSVALLNEQTTDKENGVEVRFAVNNRHDMGEFSETARKVYRWFKVKPEIIGNAVGIAEIKYKERDIAPGIHLLADRYHDRWSSQSYAMMGNVVYPIKLPTNDSIPNDMIYLLRNRDYLFEFAIGELDVAASREELSYDDATVQAILKRVQLLYAKAAEYLEAQVTNEKTDWAKACKLLTVISSDNTLFGKAAEHFIKNGKNPVLRKMLDITQYHTRIRLTLKESAYNSKIVGLSYVSAIETSNSDEVRLSRLNEYKNYDTKESIWDLDSDTIFIVQNDRGNLLGRIRKAAVDGKFGNKHRPKIFIVRRARKEGDPEKVWEKISKLLGNPPMMLSSTLPQLAKAVKTKNGEVKAYTFEKCSGNSRWSPDVYKFRPGPKRLKDFDRVDGKVVYLPLHGKQAKWGDKVMSASDLLMRLENDNDGMFELINFDQKDKINPDKIYGVNGASLKTAEASPDWISLADIVNERLNNLDWTALENDVERASRAAVLDGADLHISTAKSEKDPLMSYDHPTSPFSALAKKAVQMRGSKQVLEQLLRLQRATKLLPDCKGKMEELEKRKADAAQEMQELVATVKATYPLIRFVHEHHYKATMEEALLDYIKAIDNRAK